MLYRQLYGDVRLHVNKISAFREGVDGLRIWEIVQKLRVEVADERVMVSPDPQQYLLVAIGGIVMSAIVLRAIAQSSVSVAFRVVEDRRAVVLQRSLDNAAAESFGRAAGLEPLALNPDGTIEEPIVGVVES